MRAREFGSAPYVFLSIALERKTMKKPQNPVKAYPTTSDIL